MHRRTFLFLCVAIWAGSFLVPALHAQVNWAPATSGTTQNLWGVAYGGGQFVAVGEGGTILTSPDGATWTARASGTNVWLTSVTYAFAHYVAVGDNGTVLASLDGVTWESVNAHTPNAPAIRLNVVRFDGAEFLAFGEHNYSTRIMLPPGLEPGSPLANDGAWWRGLAVGLGHTVIGGQLGLVVQEWNAPYLSWNVSLAPAPIQDVAAVMIDHEAFVAVGGAGAIVTSSDGEVWTPQVSGTAENLQDLATFNNTLIAVGDGGTILSLDERGAWARRSAPTTQLLLGVAGSDTTAVVVGFGGTILRSGAAVQAPAILLSPVSRSETLGGAASFVVRASGSAPLSYQWFRDQVPLAGETRPALTRIPLQPGDAGSYTVTVTNAAGSVTSSAATLNVLPAPAAIVDPAFNADASLDGSPSAVLPLADGGVLVADGKKNQLVKLRADGSLDPAWTIPTLGPIGNSSAPFVSVLAAQPDGRILVGGFFATLTGPARTSLIRLNRDGTIDGTFAAAPEATTTTRSVTGLALQVDDKILVANNGTVPFRLLTDGSLDPIFHPQPLAPGVTRFGELRNWGIRSIGAAANGKVVVGANVDLKFTNDYPLPKAKLVRYQSDGALDPTFAPLSWDGGFAAMRVLDDDGVLAVGALYRDGPLGPPVAGVVFRVRSDGSPNPAYVSPTVPPPGNVYIYPSGALILSEWTQPGLTRYTPLGAVDSGFTGGVGFSTVVAAAANDQLYVAGAFTLYNGRPSQHVARLNAVANGSVNAPRILSFTADKTTVSYGETITVRAAVTGSADLTFDWDGAPNVFPATLTTVTPTLTFAFQSGAQPNILTLIARNPSGVATSAQITFTVLPDAPVITSQPVRVSAQSGRDLALSVERNPNAGNTLVYEWRRNGQIVAQPADQYPGQTLFIPQVTAAAAGDYTLTIRNALGVSVTSAPMVLTIDDSSRLANLSTRAFVGPGEQVLIAGFSISGVSTRQVLVRAIGPGLARFGVADALPYPQISLRDARTGSDHSLSFSTDGWDANSSDGNAYLRAAFDRVGAFPLEPGSKDQAGTTILVPGNYTVQIADKSGHSGTALVEIYEFDNAAARMLNVSSRAMVKPGAPAICGLSIQGPVAKRVLLRGAGPTLGLFGVAGTLTNPRLTLKDATGVTLAMNDDWETNANATELRTTMSSVGAFAFSAGSKDAALLVTLPPGNYTMILEGGPAESGVALVEAYEVP